MDPAADLAPNAIDLRDRRAGRHADVRPDVDDVPPDVLGPDLMDVDDTRHRARQCFHAGHTIGGLMIPPMTPAPTKFQADAETMK